MQWNSFSILTSNYLKVIGSAAFKESQRISVYLSLDCEVSTKDILSEMFRLNKEVLDSVPTFNHRSTSQFIQLWRLSSIDRYSFHLTVVIRW